MTSINSSNDYPPATPEIILELFQQFRSSNDEQVQKASKHLIYYQKNAPADVISIASNLLLDDSHEDYVYRFSAIYINKVLSQTIYFTSPNRFSFWKQLDESVMGIIHQGTFRGLMFKDQVTRNLCAKSISLIARIEVNNSSYSNLFDNIFQIISDDKFGEYSKLGGIRAIIELLDVHTNKDPVIPKKNMEEIGSNIFQIISTILQNKQVSTEYKTETADCARVFLKFFAPNIQEQYQALLELTLSILPIGLPAYRLLLKICKTFYEQLVPDPIKSVFDEISKDISSTDNQRKSLALNFWYRFSKFEFKKYNENQKNQDITFHNISNQLSEALSKPILDNLPKFVGESDVSLFDEPDDNYLSDLTICCLKQFAQIPENQEIIANNVVNFYQEFISDENPINRYSAVFSLRSIVFINDQPQLTDFFMSTVNTLIGLISNDNSVNVNCISILVLSKIYAHHIDPKENELYSQVIDFSVKLLGGNDIMILSSTCKMLSTIFKHCGINQYGQNFIIQIFNTIFPFMITLLDKPNIFEDQFLRLLQEAFVELIIAMPEPLYDNIDMYFNSVVEIGTRLENAIKEADFPDPNSKEMMIGVYCSIILKFYQKFKNIPANFYENLGEITSHILDILIDSITTSPDLCECDILGAIAAIVLYDTFSARVIENRLDQVCHTIINIYTTSESPQVIKIAGNILKDLIYIYKSYFQQSNVENDPEKNLAVYLLEFTLKYFNTILFIPFQVYIFGVVGDMFSIIDDPGLNYTNDIISGLTYLRYMLIPKDEEKLNSIRLQSMLYVSAKLIAKYKNYDINFYTKNKGILFFAALEVSKNQEEDHDLIESFLQFLDTILHLKRNYFNVFSIYIRRNIIIAYLENEEIFKNDKEKRNYLKEKSNRILSLIFKNT